MRVTLANATLATLSPPQVHSAHVTVADGIIDRIHSSLDAQSENVVDCTGMIIIPGNVCAHTHLYSSLARGMPAPREAPRNFRETLQYLWWKLDEALDEGDIFSSGLVGTLDAVRSGTTTLVDHHSSPNAIDGSLDVLGSALDDIGVRGILCYEVTDRGGAGRRDAGLKENERFLRTNRRQRVRGTVGAHASFTLEDETLRRLSDLAAEYSTGVHIHVAEDAFDEEDSIARSGMRTAERLCHAGILTSRSILAHGVHLNEEEIGLAQHTRSWLVHNCRSNMNNSVGRANVQRFGERVALGTDGIDGDMFAESRTAFFRGRETSGAATADHYSHMLASGGSLVSEFFGTSVRNLEVGAVADIVLLEYDPPTPLTAMNFAWHWMFAMNSSMVRSVMVDGRWIYRDREFVNIDEERIRAEARLRAQRLWKRMETR